MTYGLLCERPTEPEPAAEDPRLRERLHALLCCLALVLLATATRPGRVIADTKIDMALRPLGFLGRALHLWDTEQFGQLQNQASGYLFPMGPFYALGHLAGMPAWITQRLWLGALLCAAFLGIRRLAERLGVGTPGTRLLGALAYALTPHGLAALGTNSSEYLPPAMLPWMLLPLVTAPLVRRGDGTAGTGEESRNGAPATADDRPARRGGRARAAARSALAVACCGGINGTATLAVLVVPVLFVLTRPRGVARIRLLAWWSAAVAMATAWWSVPLLLLGRYAFSWLPYTETARTTTATTGAVNVLRGTERWVNFLVVDGGSWWPLGHAFATGTLPVLLTGLLAALGLAGLVRAGLPERAFLITALLLGVAIMVAGHAGPPAGEARRLIDGPLAPFRNLYKFDALVRLPLALGLAHLATARGRGRVPHRVAAVIALGGVAVTALGTGLSAAGDFPEIPAYWRQATSWLNARAGEQAVLAVPGARFGEYVWGRPMDDVTQPLLRVRWGERQLVPAGSAGLTRLLDGIDQRITSGQGSAGLTEVLARMDVRYLLVRNDLRREDLRGAWPARVHQALNASPGIRRVAWFGNVPVGTAYPDDATTTLDQPYPPVEIYEVAGADDAVSLTDADRALRLYGSPEALLSMADNGLLKGRPVLLDDDGRGGPAAAVDADSLRRVERNFGELRGQISPTMTAADRRDLPGPRRDILEPGWDRYSTVASYSGIADVTASSSAADAGSIAQLDEPGGLPYAALDGNPWTRWETGGWNGPVGQWLKIDFGRPLTASRVRAVFTQDRWLGPSPDTISVETEHGRAVQRLARTPAAQSLRVPPGRTRWLRIRILRLAWRPPVPALARVGLAELTIGGVHAKRDYDMPAASAGAAIVMSRAPGRQPACMRGPMRWVCAPSEARQDEEGYGFARDVSLPAVTTGVLSGRATLTDPALVQRYTSIDPRLTIRASSALTSEPAGMPRSAFDGDPATTWVPAVGDHAPWLRLSWGRAVRLGRLALRRPYGVAGPAQIRVEGDGDQWREGQTDGVGAFVFKPMRTTHLTIRFSGAPPQITDVRLPGIAPFPSWPGRVVRLPCGYGPRFTVGGTYVPTRATGTYGDLLAGRPMAFRACHAVRAGAGDNELAAVPFDAFRVDSAVLDPRGTIRAAPPAESSSVTVTRWSTEHRAVRVHADRDSYLVVNENANAGWKARLGGRTLRAARLDGWRQAWLVPAGTDGTVRLTYRPDRPYQASVLVGLNLLVVLLLVALWPRRRPKAPESGPPTGRDRPRSAAELVLRRRHRVRRATAAMAVLLVSAVLGYWVDGLAGSGVALVVTVVFAWAPSWLRRWTLAPWLTAATMMAATACLAAGLWLQARQHPAGHLLVETLPQSLSLVVLARLVVALRGTPDRRPAAGRSTADRAGRIVYTSKDVRRGS